MLHKLLILLILFPITNFSQTKFTSSKYNYSFIIPEGWHVKDKIFNPDVDAKIVDGKGNSFIVSIKTFPTATKLTAKQQMESTTNQEMEEQFNAVYGTAKVIKRSSNDQKKIKFYSFLFIYRLLSWITQAELAWQRTPSPKESSTS